MARLNSRLFSFLFLLQFYQGFKMKIWNIRIKRLDDGYYVRLTDVIRVIQKVYRLVPNRPMLFLLNLFKGGDIE